MDDDLAELPDLRVHTERCHPLDSSMTCVPPVPPTSASMSSSDPIAARFPVEAANSVAAATFGPIEPAGRSRPSSSAGVARSIRAWRRLAPVAIDAVDIGRHDEEIGPELAREQAAREVLVDDRLDADELAVVVAGVHRRDAAAAGADDHGPLLQEPTHRAYLEDPLRSRRRHDPPPTRSVRLDVPTLVGGERLRSRLVVDRPDELRRVGEGRVVGIDLDHRQDASRAADRTGGGCRPPARPCSRSSPGSRRQGHRADTRRRPCTRLPAARAGRPAARFRGR